MDRDPTIDIAKGLGISLVVLGHAPFINAEPGFTHKLIYSFHMPLFFFIAGMFLRTNMTFISLVRHKADAVLKPYWLVLLLAMPYWVLVRDNSIPGYLFRVAWGTDAPLLGSWFLPQLFSVTLFAWLFVRIPFTNGMVRVALLVACLLGGIEAAMEFKTVHVNFAGKQRDMLGLPLGLDMVPLVGFWFLAGHYGGRWMLQKSRAWKTMPHLVGSIVLGAVCLVLVNMSNPTTLGMWGRGYGDPLITTMGVAIGISLTFQVAEFLTRKWQGVGHIFESIGHETLMILLLHSFFLGLTRAAYTRLGFPAWVGFAGCALWHRPPHGHCCLRADDTKPESSGLPAPAAQQGANRMNAGWQASFMGLWMAAASSLARSEGIQDGIREGVAELLVRANCRCKTGRDWCDYLTRMSARMAHGT